MRNDKPEKRGGEKRRERVPHGTFRPSRAVLDKGPENVGEILSRLFTARGWGRRQERLRLEEAWADAVGPEGIGHTRVGALRRGVLEVTVDGSALLQELASFHKRRLLQELRQRLPGTPLTDLRFRAGVVKDNA
jgi:predicted nucleic acid-binding Zn ribbon protein